MARSDRKRPRMGLADGYESARAADIARYGVRKRGEDDVIQGHVVEEDGLVEPVGASSSSPAPEGRMRVAHHPADGVPASPAGELELAPTNSNGQDAYSALPASATVAAEGREGARAALAHQRAASSELGLAATDALMAGERRALRRKVAAWAVLLVILVFFSLCIFSVSSSPYIGFYHVFSPLEIAQVLFDHLHNGIGSMTHLFAPKDTDGYSHQYLYQAVMDKLGVIGITLLAAVLLSVSGMLYQNVFKNPIAGPGMLGVSSGVTLGNALLVYWYGVNATSMLVERYAWCYGLGAAVLVFVVLAGKRLSGPGRAFDIVTMLLIGSILGQLVGFIVSYLTLFVMDPDIYQIYMTLSQMLVVDVSPVSWACLLAASAVSLAPVWFLRFRLNALAFDDQEVRLFGVNMTALRAVALVCGAIMILAAQIHIGAVAMVSLIVPFLSRSWFGCEFRKQLVGNVCISTILLLVCRDIVDLIPFVGDGLGVGTAVSVAALPIFLLIMSRHMRGWE